MKKSQVMDTMTWIEKTGNKVEIESKVHIKAGLKPKIKNMLKENLNNELDKEISGKGIKPYKNMSSSNTYNDMRTHELIDHHLDGLMHHLEKAGIKGNGVMKAFSKLGCEIKKHGEDMKKGIKYCSDSSSESDDEKPMKGKGLKGSKTMKDKMAKLRAMKNC
jgi:hypothetical protein